MGQLFLLSSSPFPSFLLPCLLSLSFLPGAPSLTHLALTRYSVEASRLSWVVRVMWKQLGPHELNVWASGCVVSPDLRASSLGPLLWLLLLPSLPFLLSLSLPSSLHTLVSPRAFLQQHRSPMALVDTSETRIICQCVLGKTRKEPPFTYIPRPRPSCLPASVASSSKWANSALNATDVKEHSHLK